MDNFKDIVNQQRIYFNSQKTKSLSFRKMHLERLKKLIIDNDKLLKTAIYEDFGKSEFDTYTTEISFILNDINYYLSNLKSLAKPKRRRTNLANLPGSSKIFPEPLGNTLVIGAWNYPYQLSLSPMIAAIAAGNTCILKPSEIAENTMKAMAKIINENFAQEYLYVLQGGIEETTELLKQKFDKIFFTGSPHVGKIIYKAAAEQLTPVTLELGGKSPAIVTQNANFNVAAKRIVWGKFLNAGQTCVAPDYILIDEKVKDSFLDTLKLYIEKFKYSEDAAHYTKIINQKNFNRLLQLIAPEKVYHGGNSNAEKRYLAPTVMHNVTWDDAVMQEEIFGPILPVLTFKNLNDALGQIAAHEKPLSAYLFTTNAEEKKQFTEKISFGGGCINDVVMHLSNDYLPFGGVGQSGIGQYHGKYGFETFSHYKSILFRANWGEPNIKYPPYTERKLSWIKKLL